jgi:rubrerythrin
MNPLTPLLHLVGSGAVAYITARNLRDLQTRPDMLAGFQLAEAGAVPLLEALSQRATAEGDAWLAERLARHAEDERRHSQIFAHALKQLNKQVVDFRSVRSEAKPDERQRSPFFEAYYEGHTREDMAPATIDWNFFFVSTHILELDASKDFLRMANALPDTDSASTNLKKGLISIAEDEKGHAAYLLEAMQRRLSYVEVTALVNHWRERKVNALMAMVSTLVKKGGEIPSLARDGVPPEMAQDATKADSALTAA